MSLFKVKFDDKERLKAHLWLLNSCTVKNPAEDHFKNAIQAAQSANIPVVVTGCVPQGAPKDKFVKGLSTVGVQQIDRVVEVVEETLKGNTVKIMGPKVGNLKMYQGAGKGRVFPMVLGIPHGAIQRLPSERRTPLNKGLHITMQDMAQDSHIRVQQCIWRSVAF